MSPTASAIFSVEQAFGGLLVLGMAAIVFYGVLKLKQMQADYESRCPPTRRPRKRSRTVRDTEEHIMWWISYRGEGQAGIDNIGVFEDDGTPRPEHPLLLDPSPNARPLHIARGFALIGADLYIANAWRKDSHIAHYRRHGDTFHFVEVIVTTKHAAAMIHPFDVEFGDDGRLYISCQDTNTVIAIPPKTRKPPPVAPHLLKNFPDGNFLPGTLVPPTRAASLTSSTTRRRMFRRRRASRSCSTCTANRVIRCAASSCIASISMWRTKPAMRSRSSR